MPSLLVLSPNFIRVETPKVTYYFSYNTCIAFTVNGSTYKATQDSDGKEWSKTTNKHFRNLPWAEWAEWLSRERFDKMLAELV